MKHRAGNHIVMGGAVNGGNLYGQYPDMLLASRSTSGQLTATSPGQDLTGNGTFVPSLSVDQYMQRLGQWFLMGTSGAAWSTSAPLSPWNNVLPNWGALKSLNENELQGFMGI